MISVAFFNNKGGVGKTSLVYHLGWMFAELGGRVLMVDLDPQSNLTAMCVEEGRLEQLWVDDDMKRRSVRGAVQPIVEGVGDIQSAHLEHLHARLALVPGDIRLSEFEVRLSDAWPRCMDRDAASFRVASSFYRIIAAAGDEHDAELAFIDVGPNLGAINRSVLISADYVVTPLGADMFSLQALRNLGPTLNRWRTEWTERLAKNPSRDLKLPAGSMTPIGYVVMQPHVYAGRVTKAYDHWLREIPAEYAQSLLGKPTPPEVTIDRDPRCLAVLRHYRSLMPLAQAVQKPIFKLTAGDGAIGAHYQAVLAVGEELRALANKIASKIEPTPTGLAKSTQS